MLNNNQLSVKERTSAVTDLHEDSRYPSLAGSVFLPVLLLIVYKKKSQPQIISLCAWANIYQISPLPTPLTFHMERVNDPVSSMRDLWVQGKGEAPHSTEPHTSRRGEWETHHDLQLQKNIGFGSAEKAPQLRSHAKAAWLLRPLAAVRSEGSKTLSWEPN